MCLLYLSYKCHLGHIQPDEYLWDNKKFYIYFANNSRDISEQLVSY